MKAVLKNDKFRKARGGYSRVLALSCEHCRGFLYNYQKDGPGILKRLYIDRIIDFTGANKNLVCRHCKTLLGVSIVYKKENRPAFRLFAGAVAKKISKK